MFTGKKKIKKPKSKIKILSNLTLLICLSFVMMKRNKTDRGLVIGKTVGSQEDRDPAAEFIW